MSIAELLGEAHRQCEALLATAEESTRIDNLSLCGERFQQLQITMEQHFTNDD